MSVSPHSIVLPQWVTPLKLAVQDTLFDGTVPWEQMPRLAELLDSVHSPITAKLHFLCDETGYRVVKGSLGAKFGLLCQRCLQSMSYDITTAVSWIIVADEEKIGSLPKRYEPWVLDDREADLYKMIEEELLLELPIVGFHSLDECAGDGSYSTGEVAVVKRPNPFEVLQGLDLKK